MPASIASRMRSEVASVRPGTRSRAARPSDSGTRRLTTGRPVSMTWMRRLVAGFPAGATSGPVGRPAVAARIGRPTRRGRPAAGTPPPASDDPRRRGRGSGRSGRQASYQPCRRRLRIERLQACAGFGDVDVAALEGAQDVHARVIRLIVARAGPAHEAEIGGGLVLGDRWLGGTAVGSDGAGQGMVALRGRSGSGATDRSTVPRATDALRTWPRTPEAPAPRGGRIGRLEASRGSVDPATTSGITAGSDGPGPRSA